MCPWDFSNKKNGWKYVKRLVKNLGKKKDLKLEKKKRFSDVSF